MLIVDQDLTLGGFEVLSLAPRSMSAVRPHARKKRLAVTVMDPLYLRDVGLLPLEGHHKASAHGRGDFSVHRRAEIFRPRPRGHIWHPRGSGGIVVPRLSSRTCSAFAVRRRDQRIRGRTRRGPGGSRC